MTTAETDPSPTTPGHPDRSRRWLWATLWLWLPAAVVAPIFIRGLEVVLVWILVSAGFVVHAVLASRRTRSAT